MDTVLSSKIDENHDAPSKITFIQSQEGRPLLVLTHYIYKLNKTTTTNKYWIYYTVAKRKKWHCHSSLSVVLFGLIYDAYSLMNKHWFIPCSFRHFSLRYLREGWGWVRDCQDRFRPLSGDSSVGLFFCNRTIDRQGRQASRSIKFRFAMICQSFKQIQTNWIV